MKNLTNTFFKKYSKILTLTGVFACMLFLSTKTFAQAYARVEQTNFHMYDSYAPYGVKCDTWIALYADEFCSQPYSTYPGNTFPSGGFDVIVRYENEYNNANGYPPYSLGNNHFYLTSDTYTLTSASGNYVSYSYSDPWAQNMESWLMIFTVVENTGSGAGAAYTPAATYPCSVNY